VRNTIDTLFSDGSGAFPGLLIDGQGRATALSSERIAIGTLLTSWSTSVTKGTGAADLDTAEQYTKRISAFLAELSTLYAEDKNTPPDLAGLGTSLAAARAQIDGTLTGISGARQALIASENALAQAKIASSNTGASASDAQIKQALGSLRLAQANLEKTIVRSPISGIVQSLTLKEGTTVTPGAPAAIISSEGALEVVTYVTDKDARTIAVGSNVLVEEIVPGVVTALASAIDPVSKKIEMRIGIAENTNSTLTNGQSVTVSLEGDKTPSTSTETAILLPIIALKMTPDGAVVFTVEGETLKAHTVVLGAIRGDSVVVEKGVTRDMTIVADARGLRDGETVVVK
jgi:RND family efflux transporter MFP subunit